MPTREHIDPFAPGPSRSELEAYVRGDLSPDQAHGVERWMESDPLTRDAVEGLCMPGALEALSGMKAPDAGRTGTWWKAGTFAFTLVVTALVLWLLIPGEPSSTPEKTQVVVEAMEAESAIQTSIDTGTAADELTMRIERASDVPESLQVGHSGVDLHNAGISIELLDSSLDTVSPVATIPPPSPDLSLPEKMVLGPSRGNRQLIFLQELKLVSPKELYRSDPLMEMEIGGVEAQYSDADAQRAAQFRPRTMPYTEYMDNALEHFTQARHKQCLQDLRLLLRQYPDDINALFYAGLCCHNLGMYDDAERYLSRAWHHSIDTFHEEAQWYHARSVLAARGMPSARPLLQAVFDRQGFYADRAAVELGR